MTTGPNANNANALTLHIDPGLEEIVPGFLENRRRDVQTLETALQQNDLNTIRVIGHRMKGDGGGYGFDVIFSEITLARAGRASFLYFLLIFDTPR